MFLCCETSLLTLLEVSEIQWSHGGIHRGIDHFYHPVRAQIVDAVFAVTITFLFFSSPFFFRRLGLLAIVSWVTAVAEIISLSRPEF